MYITDIKSIKTIFHDISKEEGTDMSSRSLFIIQIILFI